MGVRPVQDNHLRIASTWLLDWLLGALVVVAVPALELARMRLWWFVTYQSRFFFGSYSMLYGSFAGSSPYILRRSTTGRPIPKTPTIA
jgi:hypothetical protein